MKVQNNELTDKNKWILTEFRLGCFVIVTLCFYLFTYHSYLLSKVVMLICYRTDSMKLQSLNTFLPDHHSKRKHSREKAGAEIWTTYFCSICPTTSSLLRHQTTPSWGFLAQKCCPIYGELFRFTPAQIVALRWPSGQVAFLTWHDFQLYRSILQSTHLKTHVYSKYVWWT